MVNSFWMVCSTSADRAMATALTICACVSPTPINRTSHLSVITCISEALSAECWFSAVLTCSLTSLSATLAVVAELGTYPQPTPASSPVNPQLPTLRLRVWPSVSKHSRPISLWQLLPHLMRLLHRKAGYSHRILLRQQNLKHGHDRHSGNGCSPKWGLNPHLSTVQLLDAAITLLDPSWVFNPVAQMWVEPTLHHTPTQQSKLRKYG